MANSVLDSRGGKDAASERYIFTEPSPLTRLIFPEADDRVLNYLDDDGLSVEPQFYAPIVPMLCINGCRGIGTGFSTDISPCDPLEVIDFLTQSLCGQPTEHFTLYPYYNGFTGTIVPIAPSKYLIKGKYTLVSDKRVHVTELPVGTWTAIFKKHLEDLVMGPTDKKTKVPTLVRDYTDSSTDSVVDFMVDFAPGVLSDLLSKECEHGCNGLEKLLKLYTTVTTTNMHAFDQDEKLRHFESHRDIIDAYMPIRYKLYEDRKTYLIGELSQTVLILSNKARFIQGLLKSPPEIELRGKPKAEVIATLEAQGYDMIDGDFRYLTRLPLDVQTAEEAAKLLAMRDAKIKELKTLKTTSIETMWLSELDKLRTGYIEHRKSLRAVPTAERPKKTNRKLKITT